MDGAQCRLECATSNHWAYSLGNAENKPISKLKAELISFWQKK
jgi:hypothetical protein